MKRTYILSLALFILFSIVLGSCGQIIEPNQFPKYVILFIGDGMGPEHIKAGEYYQGHASSFTDFPVHATITTSSFGGEVTDSAAAATAIATGRKVSNGVLSVALPGDGTPLQTMLEKASRKSMLTGLVTTTHLTHATPAAFGAHRVSRNMFSEIAQDYFGVSRPNLLLGGGANGISESQAIAGAYDIVHTFSELESVPFKMRIAGLFGTGYLPYEFYGGPRLEGFPDIRDMTVHAIRLLSSGGNGFFLMVEGGLIDTASHSNSANLMVAEVAGFDKAVRSAVEWARGRTDVLILVTADHETGDIQGVINSGTGQVPEVKWGSTGHTSRKVDLFAWGCGADRFLTVQENTEILKALQW